MNVHQSNLNLRRQTPWKLANCTSDFGMEYRKIMAITHRLTYTKIETLNKTKLRLLVKS